MRLLRLRQVAAPGALPMRKRYIPEDWDEVRGYVMAAAVIVLFGGLIVYIIVSAILGEPYPAGCVLENDFCQGDYDKGGFR